MSVLQKLHTLLGIQDDMPKETAAAVLEMLTKDMDDAVKRSAVQRINKVLNNTDAYFTAPTHIKPEFRVFATAQYVKLRPNASENDPGITMKAYWYVARKN